MLAWNLENITKSNNDYRRVLTTTKHQQLVIMSIINRIAPEVHDVNDQFIKIEQGNALVILNNKDYYHLQDGDSINIPSGTLHEVINKNPSHPLKLYNIYSPPHHLPNTHHIYQPLDEA